MALAEHGLCEVCDDLIEEPRVALGFMTCRHCAPARKPGLQVVTHGNSWLWNAGPQMARSGVDA